MNTRLNYMYRDASNYKQHGEAVFEGEISDKEFKTIMGALYDGEWFIASQVGLEDLQLQVPRSYYDEDDHVWSEFVGFEKTYAPADSGPISEFAARFVDIDWDIEGAAKRLGLAS